MKLARPRRSAALITGWCLLAILSVTDATGAEVTFRWQSHASGCRETVAQGTSGTLTDRDGDWTPASVDSRYREVALRFIPKDDDSVSSQWYFHLRAPFGEELLPGTYAFTGGSPFAPDVPQLELSHKTACGTPESFHVDVSESRFNLYGVPIRFAAAFSFRCRGAISRKCPPGTGVLRGSLDYTAEGTLGATVMGRGNVLLSSHSYRLGYGNLFEITSGGEPVQTIPMARPTGGPPAPADLDAIGNPIQDLVVDGLGRVHVLIGGRTSRDGAPWASLATFDPAAGNWAYRRLDPDRSPSTRGVQLARGLTALGRYLFVAVSEQRTGSSRLLRLDTQDALSTRRFAEAPASPTFVAGPAYTDLIAGLDGWLYALRSNSTEVEVYDPETLERVRSLKLATACDGIAVDAAGTLFGFRTGSGAIYRFTSSGDLENQLDTPLRRFELTPIDIRVSRGGAILVGLKQGNLLGVSVATTDVQLESLELITPFPETRERATEAYVTFVEPPPEAASEPETRSTR